LRKGEKRAGDSGGEDVDRCASIYIGLTCDILIILTMCVEACYIYRARYTQPTSPRNPKMHRNEEELNNILM